MSENVYVSLGNWDQFKNKNLDKFKRAAFHQNRYKTRRSGLAGLHVLIVRRGTIDLLVLKRSIVPVLIVQKHRNELLHENHY